MGKVRKEKKGIKSKKKLIIKKSLGERERNEKKNGDVDCAGVDVGFGIMDIRRCVGMANLLKIRSILRTDI